MILIFYNAIFDGIDKGFLKEDSIAIIQSCMSVRICFDAIGEFESISSIICNNFCFLHLIVIGRCCKCSNRD